jgi:glutathione synthase/RimK-type ligase-like ATP-grasp enzyme
MIVSVLIVSSIYDFSVDLVTQALEQRGIPFLRLNKEHFSDYRVTVIPDKVLMEVKSFGGSYVVDGNIKSIWYRQPIFLRNTPGESLTVKEQLNRSQWMGFLRSLSIFSEARWMNWPESTYLAETKAYQLMEAHKLGFKIPETRIGNDVEGFNAFKGDVIIKSLDTVLLRDGKDCLFTYTTIKTPNEFRDEDISEAPLTVQEYIHPKMDIRVTVVGDEVFAVKITSGGESIKEDWRIIARDKVEYTSIDLPHNISMLCMQLMERLKLNFGAIDLVESNGEYVFIEINPTGEWGWLVTPSRRIDTSITDWLAGLP